MILKSKVQHEANIALEEYIGCSIHRRLDDGFMLTIGSVIRANRVGDYVELTSKVTDEETIKGMTKSETVSISSDRYLI